MVLDGQRLARLARVARLASRSASDSNPRTETDADVVVRVIEQPSAVAAGAGGVVSTPASALAGWPMVWRVEPAHSVAHLSLAHVARFLRGRLVLHSGKESLFFKQR